MIKDCKTVGALDIHFINYMNRRVSYQVRLRYGINMQELWLLSCLSGHLNQLEQTICSRDTFLETVTGNFKYRSKMMGFYNGLIRLKMIGSYEYTRTKGSVSIGLSDLGSQCLAYYLEQFNAFSVKFGPKRDIVPSAENAMPSYYRLIA